MGGGAGKALGAAGKGPAKGGAGKAIGGFLGGMGEGVMKGAAAGLSAFGKGSVSILLGATTVAGVITAIGAGIAAAAWLTGKALPSFVSGIKEFENLDGTKLADAASGMLAISGAMAAFGAGTAVAGLGSLVGGITSSLAGLFGGETDPLAQMKKFSDANIDGAKVKANAEALVAFNTAMAGAGVANASAGAGSIISSISSFFGGDTPFEKLMADIKVFGATDIDSSKISSNASALKLFVDALSGMSTAEISEIEIPKNLASRLTDLSNVPTLDNIAQGMTNIATVSGLDTNIDKLNSLDADNLNNFAEAMENLVEVLGKLNDELAEDNKGLFGNGTGTSAADVVSQMQNGTSLSASKLERVIRELQEIKKITKDNAAVS